MIKGKNIYESDTAIPPGETLSEVLSYQGMKQLDLATRVGMAEQTINGIIKGKKPITPETAVVKTNTKITVVAFLAILLSSAKLLKDDIIEININGKVIILNKSTYPLPINESQEFKALVFSNIPLVINVFKISP